MDNENPYTDSNQDLISNTTSEEDVISTLARRGCSDLTADIDMAKCSNLPLTGGGFCDVYRGSLNYGRRIAIKSLRLYDRPGKDNEKEKILKRAARELYHWSKLKHPNILPLMGLAMFRGHLSMISEWMEKGSLMTYVSLNPDADRISLCIDICAGLSHIHGIDMVHGDIKAANVMVSHSDTAMIGDFGNSQLKDLTLRFTNTTSSSISVRWAVLGHFRLLGLADRLWQAPELLLGEGDGDDSRVTKESDVYAYGMTVLETMTGKVPFDEFGERRVLALVGLKSQTPTRPKVGISDETWEVLRCCWKREKSARPDMRSVEKLLREIYFQTWMESRGRGKLKPGDFKMNESAMPYVKPDSTGRLDSPPGDYLRRLRNLSILAEERAEKGQRSEAESLGIEVVAVMKRMLGEHHPDTLRSMMDLAITYEEQGRLAEAESLGAEVVAIMKRVLGEHHPDTLRCMMNLAITYQQQGRLAEAESLGVKVVAARKRVLGEHHPDTLRGMMNLAITYEERGRLPEAESLGVELVAIMKRVLGEHQADTLRSMMSLAIIYQKQGRLAEAESLGAEVVAFRKWVLGEHHPDTLRSTMNLAITYEEQGRLAKAESLGVEVVAVMKQVLGEDYPDTPRSMMNLAITYEKQGRLEEAESLEVEVVAVRKRVLGEHHPDTLRSMMNLAITYEEQGRLAEAELLGDGIMVVRKRVLGEDHPDTLRSVMNLAITYQKWGRLAEAESLGVEVVAARKRVLGEHHPGTLRSMMNLAITYKKQDQLAEAESLVVKVLAAQERMLGMHHPDTLETIRWLRGIYQAQRRHAELEALIAQLDRLKVTVDYN